MESNNCSNRHRVTWPRKAPHPAWGRLARAPSAPVSPSIYAYTYELPGDGQAQIYASLNQCMRAGDRAGLEFWRPFIWYLAAGPPGSAQMVIKLAGPLLIHLNPALWTPCPERNL